MTLNRDEESPATPTGFQHISDILPAVIEAIVQQAAAQHADRPISGDRGYRWAA